MLAVCSACGPRTEPFRTAPRPATHDYLSAVPAGHTEYDNQSLAEAFIKLTFWTEGGEFRPGIMRFDEKIRVSMRGPGSEDHKTFLADFLAQLRTHAGLDIKMGAAPGDIAIRFVPGEEYNELFNSQCNVIFWQPNWSRYRSSGRTWPKGWTGEPMKATAIIPDTHEPYKIRECIIEEVTQALGPINDIYGLGPTIFNDDNGHTWPTKLDHLMLRVLYDPRMKRGLKFKEAQARAIEILDEINPEGRSPDVSGLAPLFQEDFAALRQRFRKIANDANKTDERLKKMRELSEETSRRFPDGAHACAMSGALAQFAEHLGADDAIELVDAAIALCTRVHGSDDIRIAQLEFTKTEIDYSAGRYRATHNRIVDLIPVFVAHGQDSYIAASQVFRLIAALKIDQPDWDGEPLSAARDWSAYAFGDDHDVTEDLRGTSGS